MSNHLEKIIEVKRTEVAKLSKDVLAHPSHPLRNILEGKSLPQRKTPSFKESLQGPGLSVIAEIKRRSPSAGRISAIEDPLRLAQTYSAGGASAISVLTDSTFFGGNLDDLHLIATNVSIPILRKDFLIDPLQIAEAVATKASAVLLIVAALDRKLGEMLREVHRMGLEALVEVHDRDELKIALDAGAQIIGVNNRDLSTFKVDLAIAEEMASHIPKGIIKVGESGIRTIEDAARMRNAGYDAILVGQALVSSTEPAEMISAFRKNTIGTG